MNRADSVSDIRVLLQKSRTRPQRARLMLDLCSAILRENVHGNKNSVETQEALLLAQQAQQLSLEINNSSLASESLIVLARSLGLCGQHQQALELLLHGEESVTKTTSKEISASYLFVRGNQYYALGEYGKAIRDYSESLATFRALNNDEYISYAINNLGASYREIGDYQKAFEAHTEALSRGLASHNPQCGTYYMQLAADYFMLDGVDKGFEYLDLAEEFFLEHKQRQGVSSTYLNRGSALLKVGKTEEGLTFLLKSLEIIEQLELKDNYSRVLMLLGDAYRLGQKHAQALRYYRRSMKEAIVRHHSELQSNLLTRIAIVQLNVNKVDDAESKLKQALCIAQENPGSPSDYSQIYEQLARVEELRHKFDKALDYYKLFYQWRNKEREHERQRSLKESQHRLEAERSAYEREVFRLRSKELEQSLELQRSETTSLAIALSQKNEVIEKLSKRLDSLAKKEDLSNADRIRGMLEEVKRYKQNREDQWANLQRQFEHTDLDFSRRLLTLYPALTLIELKVCMLMRLSLSSKDIANILWTSSRTVETHRYSIRKKLQLPSLENLALFLTRI